MFLLTNLSLLLTPFGSYFLNAALVGTFVVVVGVFVVVVGVIVVVVVVVVGTFVVVVGTFVVVVGIIVVVVVIDVVVVGIVVVGSSIALGICICGGLSPDPSLDSAIQYTSLKSAGSNPISKCCLQKIFLLQLIFNFVFQL